MKLLTCGCSFSRGPTAWPYHVARNLNADLVNLAQAGAGNTYISRSVMSHVQKKSYDLVLIMWSGLERIDLQVENIDLFDQTIYTSKYQSLQNDWPEKIVSPINDQDYVEKNWVFGIGHINRDQYLLETELFLKQYEYQDLTNHMARSFYDMLSLENFLKVRQVPYVFAFYKPYDIGWQRWSQNLDQSNLYMESNLFHLAVSENDFESDRLHPGPAAQRKWAQDFAQWIRKKFGMPNVHRQ